MLTPRTCPVCASELLALPRSAEWIGQESEDRESFVAERLGYRPTRPESMDLTEFMHGGPAILLSCPTCGLLFRREGQHPQYQDDVYDPALMRHLFPGYLRAFERKKSQYRNLLRQGAEVIEIGSHTGAFLQAAEEWGWRPTGLDIGKSTSEFARRQGFQVKRLPIEDYAPRLKKPDAIFIWNCFEQLEDPSIALNRSHQLLDPHGLLVLRVPNADFYRVHRRQFAARHSARARRWLGYNNLLGFPYLHGYSVRSLHQLLRRHQFEPIARYDSSLLTPPYPEMPEWVKKEWRDARLQGEHPSAAGGPWIEVLSRRQATG